MNSFFIAGRGVPGATAVLLPEEARHATQVLRLRPGDRFCAVDEAGARFLAELGEPSGEGCLCRLRERLPDNESPLRLAVYQGIPKGDRLEQLAQKLTELGVARLVPVQMERCVVRPDGHDAQRKAERLARISREAAKQCRRGRAMEISPPRSWRQLEEPLRRHELLLVPWEEAEGRGLRAVQGDFPAVRDIGVVIGPEGGMSAAEVDRLAQLGAQVVTLGPRILRTDTASVAVAALAMFLWGDLG